MIYFNVIVINLTQYYTIKLNWKGDAQYKQEKMPHDLKNWYRVEENEKVLN